MVPPLELLLVLLPEEHHLLPGVGAFDPARRVVPGHEEKLAAYPGDELRLRPAGVPLVCADVTDLSTEPLQDPPEHRGVLPAPGCQGLGVDWLVLGMAFGRQVQLAKVSLLGWGVLDPYRVPGTLLPDAAAARVDGDMLLSRSSEIF